ncbi:hypothetical protein [Flavobacterium sp.]|jgi:hypothetical protein|uniref:hypothetical protein n=1 Tax=Flavobacterium sp. TaxID=239 RepID=UPI0037BFCD59
MAITKINYNIKNQKSISKINFKNQFQQLKIAIAIAIDIEILSLLCIKIPLNGFLLVL